MGGRVSGGWARGGIGRWLLFAAALHALVYLLALPPWMGEDEPWHLEYVHHVADGSLPIESDLDLGFHTLAEMPFAHMQLVRRIGGADPVEVRRCEEEILASMQAHGTWGRVDWLPRERGATDFDPVVWSFTAAAQPPGYYLVAGAWAALWGGGDVERELWAVRGLSALFYLVVVALTLLLARAALADECAAVLATAFVAWWPMHARQAAVVSNDVLVKVLLAWILLLAAREALGRGDRRGRIGLGVLCALGVLTKTTAVVGAPVALLGLAMGRLAAPRSEAGADGPGGARPPILVPAVLTVLAVALGVGYWLTHDNPALPRNLQAFQERIARGLEPEQFARLWRTAVGTFGWESRELPGWMYAVAGLLVGVALPGVLLVLLRPGLGERAGGVLRDGARRVVLLCASAVVIQLALVVARGEARGRYVLVLIPAFGFLWAVGILAPLPARWRPRVTGALVLALIAFDAAFLSCGLVWHGWVLQGS